MRLDVDREMTLEKLQVAAWPCHHGHDAGGTLGRREADPGQVPESERHQHSHSPGSWREKWISEDKHD